MSKRKAKRNVLPRKQAEAPSDDLPPMPVETPENRNWGDCMRALDTTMFDGKGRAIHCDWSKHYIKETAEALFAWMVRYEDEHYDRCRGANAADALGAALSRIDTMAYWLRVNRRDGFATEVEERAKALLAMCPFRGYASDEALKMAQDDRTFDQVQPELWMMVHDFQEQLKRLLVLLGEADALDGGKALDGEGVKPDNMEQPWAAAAPEYLPNTEALKLADGDQLDLKKLGRLLTPDGDIRYMRKGRRCKVHIGDFRHYLSAQKGGAVTDEAIDDYLRGVVKRKAAVDRSKRAAR